MNSDITRKINEEIYTLYFGATMHKYFLTAFILLFSISTLASMPLEVSMLKVVSASDHILTVKVRDVDMIDGVGRKITDLNAMTGPGNKNLIRLICNVKDVHLTNSKEVPSVVKIPLDGFMHYSFRQIKEVYKGDNLPIIAVLKGEKFLPVYDGIFSYPTYELETIMALKNMNKQ